MLETRKKPPTRRSLGERRHLGLVLRYVAPVSLLKCKECEFQRSLQIVCLVKAIAGEKINYKEEGR